MQFNFLIERDVIELLRAQNKITMNETTEPTFPRHVKDPIERIEHKQNIRKELLMYLSGEDLRKLFELDVRRINNDK